MVKDTVSHLNTLYSSGLLKEIMRIGFKPGSILIYHSGQHMSYTIIRKSGYILHTAGWNYGITWSLNEIIYYE